MRVGEKSDLIPPICLVATSTPYIFGEASHAGSDPLTTALQPWKGPFSLDVLLVSNGQDAGREEWREGGMFSEEQEGSWLPSQLCGWQWAKRSCSLSPSIKKKCVILKVQKGNPNPNNLQIILTWWWPDTPETNHGRGNSNFFLLLSGKGSLFLFPGLVSTEQHCLVSCSQRPGPAWAPHHSKEENTEASPLFSLRRMVVKLEAWGQWELH